MPKFTLTCEHRKPWDESLDTRITVEFDKENITEVVDQFQDFLRGCGYYFDGRLEIVTDEEVEADGEQFSEEAKQSARAFEAFDDMASSLMSDSFTLTLSDYGAAQPMSIDLSEFTQTTCPVCKLDAEVMSRHKCFDPKCGLK